MKNKKSLTYIRSSNLSLKFTNKQKLAQLKKLNAEYTRVVNAFIEILWCKGEEYIPSLLPREITEQVESWLSARMMQCAGKQASGIVRGLFVKQKRRIYVYDKFIAERNIKKAKKLKVFIDNFNTTMPHLDYIPMELDSRFVKIDINNETNFDIWVTLTSLGNKEKIKIPLKRTKHFNKFFKKENSKMLAGIRIGNNAITIMFEIPRELKTKGEVLGIDIGSLNVVSCSNGFQSELGLGVIQKKIARKKKGSKAYTRALIERKNFVNHSINELNLNNVSCVKQENIKNMKKGVRTNKYLTAWSYPEIFDKLERYCEEQNVSVQKISPTYTSQRCSVCGWTRKSNRKGKTFKCSHCGFEADADLNASKNIALNLREIGKKERLSRPSIKGFYWN